MFTNSGAPVISSHYLGTAQDGRADNEWREGEEEGRNGNKRRKMQILGSWEELSWTFNLPWPAMDWRELVLFFEGKLIFEMVFQLINLSVFYLFAYGICHSKYFDSLK